MVSRMKISARLMTAFGIVLLFIVAIGGANFWGTGRLQFHINDLTRVHGKLMENAHRTQTAINVMRRYEKDLFINIGDSARMDGYRKKWADTREGFTTWVTASDKLVSAPGYPDTARDRATIAAIRKMSDAYADGFAKVCDDIAAGKITTTQDANRAIEQYKDATHQAEALVGEFAKKMDDAMERTTNEATDNAKVIRIGVLLVALAAIPLALVLALVIIRSITVPLGRLVAVTTAIAAGDLTADVAVTSKDEIGQLMAAMKRMSENLRAVIGQVTATATQVASAASQLNSAARNIATGTEEVAAQANTVSTAGEEMTATSQDIAANCQLAADGARRATQSAQDGAAVVDRTIAVMHQITEKVQESARTVDSLGARSDQIGAIIGTIEDIADQTNLLALNAAIEAARAGEQGRGFAVVADEVRALAVRTTRATKEIGDTIKTIQNETRGAVAVMEQGVRQVEGGTTEAARSGEALTHILEQINSVALQVNQIATAAEEQTATTGEISSNMQQITEVVQQSARGAHESAVAAGQLSGVAEELQRLVRQFKL